MNSVLIAIATCCQLFSGGDVPSEDVRQLARRGIEAMGGETALRGIERVRFDMVTQWHITSFADTPFPATISYELHTDVRDYTLNAWRNTRRFPMPMRSDWRTITDVVRGSVAIRDAGNGWAPLSIAYVDERDELFALTPDRLMLAIIDAAELRSGPDTTIAGVSHARAQFDVGRLAMTAFLRRADGLPRLVRFRAAAPNDFGLVPWGEMEVEVWYSQWSPFPKKVTLPTQWDVRRFGATYKRMTVLGAQFNGTFAADSFPVAPELRDAYDRTATRPMHDLPLDSARTISDDADFVEFRTFGAPTGAVRVGGRWILLETGQAALSLERALEWLGTHTAGGIDYAIAGAAGGNGGAAAAAAHNLPLLVGPGAQPFIDRVLDGANRPRSDARPLQLPTTLRVGTDSVSIERIDLPGAAGSILLWLPSKRWLWAPDAMTPLDLRLVRAYAEQRGWSAAMIGNRRMLRLPF